MFSPPIIYSARSNSRHMSGAKLARGSALNTIFAPCLMSEVVTTITSPACSCGSSARPAWISDTSYRPARRLPSVTLKRTTVLSATSSKPPDSGNGLQKRHAARYRHHAGLLDSARNGNALAMVLLDENCDLRILHILGAKLFCKLLLKLPRGFAASGHLPDKWEIDCASLRNLNGFGEVRRLKHCNIQDIHRAYLIGFALGVRHSPIGLRRLFDSCGVVTLVSAQREKLGRAPPPPPQALPWSRR